MSRLNPDLAHALTKISGELLLKATQTPDLETALKQILREYFTLKVKELNKALEGFETKWDMSFDQFKEKCEKNEINDDIYSYEIEKDFWDWEMVHSLKDHYETLSSQWI